MKLEPKQEGEASPSIDTGLPKTISEAQAYLESLFETVVDGVQSGRDADGLPYICFCFEAIGADRDDEGKLATAWLLCAMWYAMETPRKRLSWRVRPSLRQHGDETSIYSRQVMS